MKEKIKKILFIKSTWFFIIFLLVLLISFLGCLAYLFGTKVVVGEFIRFFNWNGWDKGIWTAVSAIVLAFTFIFIAIQACATKKFTKFSVMPNVYFFLRSKKTLLKRLNNKSNLDFPESMRADEKLETLFIIVKNSMFPIKFKVKIIFEINGKRKPPLKEYWDKPLPVSFRISKYPNVINLEKFTGEIDGIKDKKIIAHIEYTYAPVFAPEVSPKIISETWTFDLEKYEWRGPAGVEDINICLPGEQELKNS